jgi:hypothetical protein
MMQIISTRRIISKHNLMTLWQDMYSQGDSFDPAVREWLGMARADICPTCQVPIAILHCYRLLSAAMVISLCYRLLPIWKTSPLWDSHFIPFPPLGCSSGRGNTFLRVDNGTWESLSLVVSKHWPNIGDSQIQCLRKQTMNKMNQHVQMSTIVEHAHIPWLFLSYIGCWILDAGYWILDAGCWILLELCGTAQIFYVELMPLWNRGDAQCSAKSPGALEAGYPTSLMEKQWKIHL